MRRIKEWLNEPVVITKLTALLHIVNAIVGTMALILMLIIRYDRA